MIEKIAEIFLKTEKPVLEIKAAPVTKKELITHFKDKKERRYFIIDREYHPKILLDYYFYEECYEYFVTCRRVEIWDDKQNPWLGRLLFQEGSKAYGTEEEVYEVIRCLKGDLYTVDVSEYERYINDHRMAFWNHKNEMFFAGEKAVLLKHPHDYEDTCRRAPEFEMRPGTLIYDIHSRRPGFRFDQPVYSYSVYKNGILILEIGNKIAQIEDVNLELIQRGKE